MSSSSKARITTFDDDPYPAIQSWDETESRTSYVGPHIPYMPDSPKVKPEPEPSHLASPGFDGSYPFSPHFPVHPAASGMGPNDHYNPGFTGSDRDSPEMSSGFHHGHTPPMSSAPNSQNVFSPVSPMTAFPKSPPPAVSDLSTSAQRPNSIPATPRRTSTYQIPAAPPPPDLTFMKDDTSYETTRLAAFDEDDVHRTRTTRRSVIPPSRQSSLMTIRSRLLGTVRRSNRHSEGKWGTVRHRNRDTLLEEGEEGARSGNYMELDDRDGAKDDHEVIGVDISSFGPEFAVPPAAAKAMESHSWDENMAYTGTGEAIDLSNLTGLDPQPKDSDAFSPTRAGTMENSDKQSYYFSADRHIPNWKPVALHSWFIGFLIVLTAAMAVGVELLFQMSDRHKFRDDNGPGLFSYKNITEDLTVLEFGIWKYLPTIVGVIYGILWKVTDEGVKRGEPYYQLSKGSKGSLAAESLNIEYHTIWSPFVPIAALKHKQFIVAACGILSFMASAGVPVLLSVFIRVHPSQKGRKKMMRDNPERYPEDKDIEKSIVVDGVFSRLLEVTLVIIMGLAIYVLVKLARRRSGLLGDPSGVAGVAAMANKSHILMDFNGLDLASEEKIHKQLNKRTYILHKGALWQAQLLKESERDNAAPKAMNPHPLLLRIKGMGPFLGFCLIVLVMLPLMVHINSLNVIIDQAPWIITGLSIIIKTLWELVEKDMRMLEPFWILFKRNAHSSVLTLDYTATIPVFIVLKALSKGHFLLAWVTFVTILIEILTVVMGSLDANGGEESTLSSKLSFFMAIVILSILIFTGLLVIKERRTPFLPRQPGTISSILAFIHQSRMLMDFDGTEEKSTLQRKKQLGKLGKTYGFGWYTGRDGKRHLGIDFEPLLDKYKFGPQNQDPRDGIIEGPSSWDRYE